jgi:hypothetical protein
MPLGDDSTATRKRSSARLRALMSTIELMTKEPFLGGDRGQANLHRDLGTVLAAAEELAAGAHRPRLGVVDEAGAKGGVPAVETLRH